MALPRLNDLLPDHLFYDPSPIRPPPPPSSILPNISRLSPAYDQFNAVVTPSHQPRRSPALSYPPTLTLDRTPMLVQFRPAFDARQANFDASAALSGRDDVGSIENQDPTVSTIRHDSVSSKTGHAGDDEQRRKHACPDCGKRFNRPSSLNIHLNTHTGIKPFLLLHYSKWADSDAYVCPFPGCERSFNVSSNMRRHFRGHANRAVPPPLPTYYKAWPDQSQVDYLLAESESNDGTEVQGYERTDSSYLHVPPPLLMDAYTRQHSEQETLKQDVFGSFMGMPRETSSAASSICPEERTLHLERRRAAEAAPERQVKSEYPYSTSDFALHSEPLSYRDISSHAYPTGPSVAGGIDDTSFAPHTVYASRRSFSPSSPSQHQTTHIDTRHWTYSPLHGSASGTYDEVYEKRANYGIPPTPPYTNEATLSPPSYSSGLIPLAHIHENGYVKTAAREKHDLAVRRGGSKSMFVSPCESYARLSSDPSTASEQERTVGVKVNARLQQPSPDTPTGNFHVSTLDGDVDHAVTSSTRSTISNSESDAWMKSRAVGMTPGAAPPPPYPLFTSLSPVVAEKHGRSVEPELTGINESERRAKRRRRK